MIPESFVQELLARVDIGEIVGRHVQLRKRGANLIGLCPFHSENTPSFTISPAKQFYHCFGCGQSGNAISFYIQFLGLSFPEAVRTLAQEVGLQVPQSPKSSQQRRIEKEQREIRSFHERLLHQAQTFYQDQLRQELPALRYLRDRGISSDTIQRFELGWAPNEWQALARIFDSYQAPELLEVGLVAEGREGRRYDRLRGRIVFPIKNQRGHTIGFGGRLIGEGQPKYLNSPETPLFSKGSELYGIWESRQSIHRAGYALVVEGYMDVIALAEQGLSNVVATLGTATTSQHLQRLTRLTNKIIFCFDGDDAGRQAAWRALENALPHVRDDLALHFMFLPQGEDPDSFARTHGLDAFNEQVQQAPAFSEFFLQEWARRFDLKLVEGRAACVHEALPYLAQLPESNFSKQLCQAFAQSVRLTFDELTVQLSQQKEQTQQAAAQQASRASGRAHSREGGQHSWAGAQQGTEKHHHRPAVHAFQYSRRYPTRQVVPLAKRLLQLLVAHPQLSTRLSADQLEIIVQSPHLLYVQELIALINDTGCAHGGAVLQVLDPQSELAVQLKEITSAVDEQEALPDPHAEWDDALKRVEIDVIKTEQLKLIEDGLKKDAERQRYQFLTRRLAELTTAT